MTRLILPIQNSTITLLQGPTLFLDDNTRVDKLSDEEFGIVSKSPAQFAEQIHTEHRCIVVELGEVGKSEGELQASQAATRLRYLFNNFRSSHPLVLGFGVLIAPKKVGKRTKNEIHVVDLGLEDAQMQNAKTTFKFKPGTQRSTLTGFYKVVSEACQKYPKLYLTIGRYNSALTRRRAEDRVIDATISLESMVQDDKNELSFKFALWNSYTSTRDPSKRMNAFELLKQLYKARSSIVHGALEEAKQKKLVEEITEKWQEIEVLAARAINYQILFLKDTDPKKWGAHLLEQTVGAKEHPNTLEA